MKKKHRNKMLYYKKYGYRKDKITCYVRMDALTSESAINIFNTAGNFYGSSINLEKTCFEEFLLQLDMRNIKWIKIQFLFPNTADIREHHHGKFFLSTRIDHTKSYEVLWYTDNLNAIEIDKHLRERFQ